MLICKVIIVVTRCKDCGEVEDEDGGEAETEFVVLGLMVPDFHAEQSPDAAAGDGYPEQACLGDAPFIALRLPFVDAVQEKRGNVDRCKINQYAVDAIGSHLLPIKIRPCSSKMMAATTSMVFILIQND